MKTFKKLVFLLLFVLLVMIAGAFYFIKTQQNIINPLAGPILKPLLSYSFENLKKSKIPSGDITFGRKVDDNTTSYTQMFYFKVPEKPGSDNFKKVSGLANFPEKPGNYPVVVMFRGFIPDETYIPGAGSEPSAKVFAANGFITLAPDFLGFGESDKPSSDSFENRFQTYTTALALLNSLSNLNSGLAASYSGSMTADLSKIGVWGHSNGGHIALAALAISGGSYPTVLWAPVSKSFPYSIIYYTDESDDQGKVLRKTLAGFEATYDTDLFSPQLFYRWIKAPIEIHQGQSDHEVPVWWSDDLVATLKKQGNDVTYFTYPGADHNLLPDGWSSAVTTSLEFYQTKLGK